jgi:hypothetical protein
MNLTANLHFVTTAPADLTMKKLAIKSVAEPLTSRLR